MTRIRLTLTGGLTTLWVDTQTDAGWRLLGNGQEYTVPAWLASQLITAGQAVDLDAPAAPSGTNASVTITSRTAQGVWSPSQAAALTHGQTISLPASERARLAAMRPGASQSFIG